jgi:hypothetical protein|tara:strand:- start:1515 stop:2603 length:1089 start_codon:yes stop_codon:yes gene_type:complete
MKKNTTIYYVSELNLPSKSAYSIHVMKMCDGFSELGYKVNLFTIKTKNSSKIFRNYNLRKKFNIFSIFNDHINLNFFLRIIFSIKILLKKIDKNNLFVSRSIIFAIIASILKKNVVLELHHEITGFTRILYFISKYLKLIENLRFIFLHKELKKYYKIEDKKNIVLDDASDVKNFSTKKTKKLTNTCVYIGSFFEGKGVEQIFRLAKKNMKINFHIYGEKKYLINKRKQTNIKIYDYVNYSKIPKILSKYNVALMPYQKKVKGRSSINLEKYMSPLKMFDYLASRMIIIASNLDVYKHILKNNFNCMLVNINDDDSWTKSINLALSHNKHNGYLKKNAFKTAKNYTWEKRCKKIILFVKRNS